MRLLIDTNVYTALRRGHGEVAERIKNAQRIVISSVVVGELLYGFRYGKRYSENRLKLDAFLRADFVDFVPVSMVTCDRYALIGAGSVLTKDAPAGKIVVGIPANPVRDVPEEQLLDNQNWKD